MSFELVWAQNPETPEVARDAASARTVYSFRAKTIDGEDISLGKLRGKALLIVNTASQCGFTSQYRSMQTLYEVYRDRGFEILAFPANDFKNQEPGENAEIKKFCELNYGTTFPLFSKISVKGVNIHPLFHYLTTETEFKGPVTWNFNKFLVNSKGRVAARFDSNIDPLSPDFIDAVERVLPESVPTQ